MIDLDEALRDYATRWDSEQPAAPDLDEVLVRARASRPSRRWSIALAAACVVALAALAVSYAVGRSADSPSARPMSHAAPRPPTAAERARLTRIALAAAVDGGDMFASADAVRTTVRSAATLLDGKRNTGVGDGPIWFVELHGHQLVDPGQDGTHAGASRAPYVYFTVPIGVVGTALSGTTHIGYDLGRLGPVVHLLAGAKTAADLARVRAFAEQAVARYGHAATIEVVRTSDFEAEMATGTSPAAQPGPQVWLVQAKGNFLCTECRGPRPVKGRYVTLITGGGVSEVGITNQPIDLARLGPVITLKG